MGEVSEMTIEATTGTGTERWVAVCPLSRIPVDRGVAALVAGIPVAVFRLAGDEVYAVDHADPATGAPVMARGLVGSRGDAPTVASPLHKETYDLRTGACLDDEHLRLRTWSVSVVDAVVHVAVE